MEKHNLLISQLKSCQIPGDLRKISSKQKRYFKIYKKLCKKDHWEKDHSLANMRKGRSLISLRYPHRLHKKKKEKEKKSPAI